MVCPRRTSAVCLNTQQTAEIELGLTGSAQLHRSQAVGHWAFLNLCRGFLIYDYGW